MEPTDQNTTQNYGNTDLEVEVGKLVSLEKRIGWMRAITMLGALVCSFWLIGHVFATHGFLAAFLAFVLLSFVYKFGVSPMFAVASSILCFRYESVGTWLPVISYILAAVLLYADLKIDRLKRLVG